MHRQKILSRTVLSFLLTLALVSTSAWARDVRELAQGAPKYMGRQLPESSYVSFKVRRLARPRVVWANFDLLRENGVEVPKEGLTPDFEKQILDAFAWAIPNERDSADSFTNEERTMYADRYGGQGLGVNWGSGRAGSMGEVQIKGIGITPLVGTGQTFDHAHGGASLEESMREAVWGEVNDQELPLGANRVIAIIDSGTATKWKDGGQEPRALIVREDPLRPAHFIAARFGQGDWGVTEDARVEAAVKQLPEDLPGTADAKAVGERLEKGMNTYVDRMADQYAAAYARSLYHGATSASNFEISGRYIDYGTQTAQKGFAPIKILDHVGAFGDVNEIKNVLIEEFHDGVAKGGTWWNNLRSLPATADLKKEFDREYDRALRKEFLVLAGTPPEVADQLAESAGAKKLDAVIRSIIQLGSGEPVNVDKEMPTNLDKIDLREILSRAAEERNPTPASIRLAVADELPDHALRTQFAEAYAQYYNELRVAATRDGVSLDALATYVRESAKIRNRRQVELIRSEMRSRNVQLIDAYKTNGDRSPIWNEINSHIAAGERSYHDVGTWQLVVKESPNPVEGFTLRHVYDAKTNQEYMVYKITTENGKGNFYGNEISESELKKASIHYTADGWASNGEARAVARGPEVEFQIPIGAPEPNAGKSVELVMHSADGKVWWKKNSANIHLNLRPEDRANACVVNLLGSWFE